MTISLRISAQAPISASGSPSNKMNTARGTASVRISMAIRNTSAMPAAIAYSIRPPAGRKPANALGGQQRRQDDGGEDQEQQRELTAAQPEIPDRGR
jgi:hypothetical protein